MSAFASFSLFEFPLVIKLRNFNFESHWNTLMFFNIKRYDVRFEYALWKNVRFCYIIQKIMSDSNIFCQTAPNLV